MYVYVYVIRGRGIKKQQKKVFAYRFLSTCSLYIEMLIREVLSATLVPKISRDWKKKR